MMKMEIDHNANIGGVVYVSPKIIGYLPAGCTHQKGPQAWMQNRIEGKPTLISQDENPWLYQ
jgi:hypothetical protein